MQEQTKSIKIDPHTHSSGLSKCSGVTYADIVIAKQAQGYDGAILTNHCQPWYYEPSSHTAYIKRVLDEYDCANAFAKSRGFRFLLGLEVSIAEPYYSDWLLYGLTAEMLKSSPCFYQLSQKQLYEYCGENGLVLVQAHPFRHQTGDPQYMHGVEINCSKGDLELWEKVVAMGEAHDLLITCGSDYHGTNPYRGGMLVPREVETSADFAEYLKTASATKIFLEDEILDLPVPQKLKNKFKNPEKSK